MKIKPLGDRVVLERVEAEEKTASGIILTGAAKEAPQFAVVVAVGPGVDTKIQLGDKVIYSKYEGTEVKLGEDAYIIIKQDEILGILED